MSAMEQSAAVTGSAEDLRITLGFEDLFEAERERLFRALLLITHDSAEAEDLMQEAFVSVWERWDRVGRLEDPVMRLPQAPAPTRAGLLPSAGSSSCRSGRPGTRPRRTGVFDRRTRRRRDRSAGPAAPRCPRSRPTAGTR